MHVAAISRNLAEAYHCLNNESQKVIYSTVGQKFTSYHHDRNKK